jgi:hypothetical protein
MRWKLGGCRSEDRSTYVGGPVSGPHGKALHGEKAVVESLLLLMVAAVFVPGYFFGRVVEVGSCEDVDLRTDRPTWADLSQVRMRKHGMV